MNIKKLSREKKEELYIKATTDLQRHWGNPIDNDWNLSNLTDDDLEAGIKNNVSQLKFEKIISPVGKLIKFLIVAFILLGVFGLLIFGIRQVF